MSLTVNRVEAEENPCLYMLIQKEQVTDSLFLSTLMTAA